MKGARGQLSVEFLLIFAVLLVILVAFIYISQSSESGVRQAKTGNEAANTVADLSAAAKEIYAQGAGAKKQVYITIPEGYEPENSFIANRSIKMRVAGNDYIEIEQFDVFGTLPASGGGHWVLVESAGSGVRIGYAMLEVDKSAIVLSMGPGDSRSVSLRVKNIWHSEINLSMAKKLNKGIAVEISPPKAGLQPSESKSILLAFEALDGIVGFFPGEMEIISDSGSAIERIRIPITIVVKADDYGPDERRIRLVPQKIEEAVERNMSLLRSIQACTDQYSSFDWIGLEKSGNIEEWISVPDSIGPLGPGECEEVWLNITTPETMELGMHQGSINFSNGFGESSILEIELVAGGKTGDVSGPEVHNITIPGNTFADSAISFFANAADNLSSVHSCTISVDSGPWLSMQAADGIFDSPEEEIIFTYPKGFGRGKHDVRMRCKDSSGNVGPEANMTFRLARELIFIQSGKEMSLSEREWSEWLSIYKSGLGFRWSHETVRADELMGIDLDDYAVVVMADYQDRPLLDMKLGSHLDSGGYLVLLGEANVEGAYALCQTAGAISTYPDKTVRVYMTDHYMASELKPGLLRIFTIDTKLYRMEGDYIGAPVIVHGSDSGFTVLGDSSGIVSWGVASPFRLNEDGIALTTRIIDYAILASHKHPGQ